jgi:hypothetical protein
MKVLLSCKGYTDRRGPRELEAARALEQARADKALEDLWRQRASQSIELRRIRRRA